MRLIYACDVCGRQYPDRSEAEACERRPDVGGLDLRVGDIVRKSGYAWYDGDSTWIANFNSRGAPPPNDPEFILSRRNKAHGNCFRACCTLDLYYVVTAISRDPRDGHRLRYHVASKAVRQESTGRWTSDTHISLRRVDDPPQAVVSGSLDLIGRVNGELL